MRLRFLPALVEEIGRTGLGVRHRACSLPWLSLGGIDDHTSTLPSLPIALLISSSLTSSPSSISLCALPEGIMGKQLARAATRQSKSTGLSGGALSMAKIASSRSAGLLHIMPMPP